MRHFQHPHTTVAGAEHSDGIGRLKNSLAYMIPSYIIVFFTAVACSVLLSASAWVVARHRESYA